MNNGQRDDMTKKCDKCGGTIDLENDGYGTSGSKYFHDPECPPSTATILPFPVIHRADDVEKALELAKGWDFKEVLIVGYVDGSGTSEGTIISSAAPADAKTAKTLLFMAELLRWQALKVVGLL